MVLCKACVTLFEQKKANQTERLFCLIFLNYLYSTLFSVHQTSNLLITLSIVFKLNNL